VRILAVSVKQKPYAEKLLTELQENNISAELAPTDETIGKRIREAELEKIPYILVVGDKEIKNNSVAVRTRGKNVISSQKLSDFLQKIQKEITNKE